MRIVLDANVLVSAILIRKSLIADMVRHIIENHKIVLSDYIIAEVEDTYKEKFPDKFHSMQTEIKELPYEIFNLNTIESSNYPQLKDADDLPILAIAIEAGADILITGDSGFDNLKISKPRIMKPREYMNEFMS